MENFVYTLSNIRKWVVLVIWETNLHYVITENLFVIDEKMLGLAPGQFFLLPKVSHCHNNFQHQEKVIYFPLNCSCKLYGKTGPLWDRFHDFTENVAF